MATPKGHFEDPPQGAGRIIEAASWLARPGMADDPSHWLPEGVDTIGAEEAAATFYIHPTTYLERDRWNAPLDAGGEPGSPRRAVRARARRARSTGSRRSGRRDIARRRSARSC